MLNAFIWLQLLCIYSILSSAIRRSDGNYDDHHALASADWRWTKNVIFFSDMRAVRVLLAFVSDIYTNCHLSNWWHCWVFFLSAVSSFFPNCAGEFVWPETNENEESWRNVQFDSFSSWQRNIIADFGWFMEMMPESGTITRSVALSILTCGCSMVL